MSVRIVDDYTEDSLKEEKTSENLGSDPSTVLQSSPRTFNDLLLILVLQKLSDTT